MSIFSKDIKTMDDLFVHMLRDIYYAEKQILKSLPDMINKATRPDLREGLQNHLGETKGHVERVEEVFRLHGAEAKAIDCPAIDGILKETRELVGDVAGPDVLDAAIIAAAQAVEHYEIPVTARWSPLQRNLAARTALPNSRPTSTRSTRPTRSSRRSRKTASTTTPRSPETGLSALADLAL